MPKQLVTGGAGFIGSHIATALVERGDQVRVLDNLSSGFEHNLAHLAGKVEFIQGDICDTAAVLSATKGVDSVFHHAALASVPASVRDPLASHAACATGTVNVLTAAQQNGVRRVVLAASSAAYGNQPHAAKREEDPLDPLSPYAAAKIASEQYCAAFTQSLGLETASLRYFNVYGPRQDPASEYSAVIPIFVSKMLSGAAPTIFGDGEQSRDFVYVADVVQANLLAAEHPNAVGRVFNVGSGRRFTLLQLMQELNSLLKTDIRPIHADPRPGDVRDSLADINRASTELGFQPKFSLSDGLRESIDYYRSIAG